MTTVFTACILAVGVPLASAGGFTLGDSANYIILYEGGNPSSALSINNFGYCDPSQPSLRCWVGDIGIAGHGKLAASGPGTLYGDINFAAANTGQASISNTTINGAVTYGVTQVQTDMNTLNTLSANLGTHSGTALTINTSSTQTVLASAGTLDVDGNRVFSITSVSSNNGQNLIIKGDGSNNVVLNVNTPGDAQFHGNIRLQDLSGLSYGAAGYSGLTPDQVLFNLYQGTALVGGDKLDANDNGDNAHPANIIEGTFLDPNGAVSFVNTRFVGHIYGGDSVNMQIVSGDTLTLPVQTPEPSSLLLLAFGLGFVGLAPRKARRL